MTSRSAGRILITGGAGFIGTHLAERLADQHDLVLFDNFRRDSLASAPALASHPRVTTLRGDVLDPAAVARAMDGVTTVLHLAAIAGVSSYYSEPLRTLRVNLLGTVNVLDRAVEQKIESLVYFSTSEVYGPNAANVQEDSGFHIGSVSDRRWVYATSKLGGEQMVLRYAEEYGFRATTVRPFNVFGPRQTGEGAISNFCKARAAGRPLKVYGSGTEVRAWCYISDLVDAVMAILSVPEAAGQAFNIGNPDEPVTTRELAERFVQLFPPTGIVTEAVDRADVQMRVPDTNRARRVLAFSPRVSLDEGLRRTYEWFAQPVGAAAHGVR